METIKKYNTSDFKLKDKVIINLGEAGKGIKSFWVDGIISDIHPNRITVQRNNSFGNEPLEEQIPNKLLTSEYIVKEEDAEMYADGGSIGKREYTEAEKWWGNDLSTNEQKEYAKKHLENFEYSELMGSTSKYSTASRRKKFINEIWEKEGKPKSVISGIYAKGGEVNEFDYMMLGRLKSDADYYLGHGNRNEKHLWALNVDDHIQEMKNRWNALPEDKKPEWLSMEDILEYERKMKNPPKSKFDYYKVPNEDLYAVIECNPEYKDNFGTECIVIRNKKTEEAAIAEVERLNKQGHSDYAKGGQLPEQKNIDLLQKGLENPLIPQNVKTKIEAKIKELQAEIDKKQQEAKKATEKPTLKDLEDRLKTVKKMAAKKPELKARVKIIEKMIAKEKKENEVEKLFSINPSAIGKAKYSINFYDGGKHKDGSEFIGIDTFKLKKDLTSAIEKYKKQGYKQVDNVFNELQKKKKTSEIQSNTIGKKTQEAIDYFEKHGFIEELNFDPKFYIKALIQFAKDGKMNKNVKDGIQYLDEMGFVEDMTTDKKHYAEILIANAKKATPKMENGGSVDEKYLVTYLTSTGRKQQKEFSTIEIAKKFGEKKSTEKAVEDVNLLMFKDNKLIKKGRFSKGKYIYPQIILENGAEVERTDHVNSFRNALVSYIKERYNEDVDLDNTLISYVENTGNKQVERAEVTTLQGNEYTVYPKDLVDRFKSGGEVDGYILGYASLGNGISVYNKAKEVGGDYETIAHISDKGEIKYRKNNLPKTVKDEIENWGKRNTQSNTITHKGYVVKRVPLSHTQGNLIITKDGKEIGIYSEELSTPDFSRKNPYKKNDKEVKELINFLVKLEKDAKEGSSSYANGGSIPVNIALQKTKGQPYEIIKNDIPRTEAQKFIEEYKQSGKPYHNIMIDDLPFEDGGRVPEELKGYRVEIYTSYDGNQPLNVVSNGQFKDMVLVTDGKTGDSSVVMSDEPYLRLQNKNVFGEIYTSVVPVNIADNKWKMFGGNFVWSSDSRFREEVSEHPLPLHDRVEYEDGGEIDIYTIFEGYDHYNQIPLFQVKGKNNDYVGEWHDDRKDAEEELKDLQPRMKKGGKIGESALHDKFTKIREKGLVYGLEKFNPDQKLKVGDTAKYEIAGKEYDVKIEDAKLLGEGWTYEFIVPKKGIYIASQSSFFQDNESIYDDKYGFIGNIKTIGKNRYLASKSSYYDYVFTSKEEAIKFLKFLYEQNMVQPIFELWKNAESFTIKNPIKDDEGNLSITKMVKYALEQYNRYGLSESLIERFAESYVKNPKYDWSSTYEDGGETWIQDATKEMKKKGTVGSFTNKAARHGLTPIEYAKKVLTNPDKHTEKTRRQAQFVKNTNPEKFN